MARSKYDRDDAPKVAVNKTTLKKLLGIYDYIVPYRGYFIAGLLCLLFSSTILLAIPFLLGKLLDVALKTATQGMFNIQATNMVSAGLEKMGVQFNSIDTIAIWLGGILVVQGMFSFFRVYFFTQTSERSTADLRKSLYERFMTVPLPFYDSRRTGELMSRITADIGMLQDTFSITLAEFFRQFSVLIGGLCILFMATPRLTFFMLGIIPVLVLAGIVFGRNIRKMAKQTQDELATANVVVEETLQSISMVKAFTNEWFEVNRYKNSLDKVVSVALKAGLFRGSFIAFIITAMFGGIIAIIWYGTKLVQLREITVGELMAFIMYTLFIAGSIGGLGDIYAQIQRAVGASERVSEILGHETETTLEQSQTAVVPAVAGNIEFKNLRFAYPTRKDVEVLGDVSFRIRAGEKVALVGHSGAGKSTMVQLLMRFYPLTSAQSGGEILLDNKNIANYELSSYRRLIGIVPQEVILFGGTIGENIAYGRPNATEAEIREAARKANALKFIESFPEGLATLVGERGVKLSGGQRQRIAIARAILKDPKILILDEATSSLDAESEQLVQEALEELMKNRTTIIIAHRLATIRKADRIYVLDKGKITESGTHDELTDLENGIYSNLIRLQMTEW